MRIGVVIIAVWFVTSVLVCPWTLNQQHQVPSVFPLPAVMFFQCKVAGGSTWGSTEAWGLTCEP